MSTSTPNYDPLPLTTDDDIGRQLYNAPHETRPSDSSLDDDPSSIPVDELGVPRPRFLGAAAYQDGNPELRNSYASSHRTYGSLQEGSQYSSSIYNLHSGGYRDDPNAPPKETAPYLEEKRAVYAAPRSRRKAILIGAAVGGLVLIIGVAVGVYFGVVKPKNATSSHNDLGGSNNTSSQDNNNAGSPTTKAAIVTGGDGSQVTLEDGSTFTYSNSFGGYWYWDNNDPYNNGAKANSWTPALNETFNYGTDRVFGVNLGGWLVLEPFIVPALFEQYQGQTPQVVDEYTLHSAMRADTANGGISQLENHYKTFITEQDFAQIAAAGLNHVRLPIPYWAIEVRDGEPYEPHIVWQYFLKAVKWARKYGIRINLDFHSLPGSQNQWNHSGKLGHMGVLNGPMGLANAQRSLDYIRIFAEFISQPQYKDVITIFGVTNEPQASTCGNDVLQSYYLQAYNAVRTASGVGAGNGPYVGLHDGFLPRTQWAGFLPGADRVILDDHPYICFGDQSDAPMSSYANTPCKTWGKAVNDSMSAFGMTVAGEFSNAVTDCGLWLNGITLPSSYASSVGSCDQWTDYTKWNQGMKNDVKNFAMASMDALQNWFFWTWKIGNSTTVGRVPSPAWSYSLGLENGWMPTDPRAAYGTCGNTDPWTPPLAPSATGGGKGVIDAAATNTLPWPPASISNGGPASSLPTYTPTGTIPTLPAAAFTGSDMAGATATPNPGSGWQNPADQAALMVNITGCTYLDPWVDVGTSPPSPLCPGSSPSS